jgi:ribosomal protein S18 acetylase RimI-like enzyme
VATTLMRSIAEVLGAEGRGYVVLSVDTPNEPARLLYDRLGFVDAARTLRVDVDSLLTDRGGRDSG